MGTAAGEDDMPEDEDKKEGVSLIEAWEKGKKIATFITVAVALFHSVYATYIKEEDEARAVFETTTKSVAEFSSQVDLQVAALQGRVDLLEKLVLLGHKDDEEGALADLEARLMALEEAEAMAEAEGDHEGDGIPDIPDAILEPDAMPVATMAAPPPDLPELPRMPKPKAKKSAGLKYEAPQAPWEQKKR